MKLTREIIKNNIENIGYIFIDEYIKMVGLEKKRRVIIQNKDGYKIDTSYFDVMNELKRERIIVNTANSFSLYNISLWININKRPFSLSDQNI